MVKVRKLGEKRCTLELLLRVQIDLLRLSDLLQDILDNDSIVLSNIPGNDTPTSQSMYIGELETKKEGQTKA